MAYRKKKENYPWRRTAPQLNLGLSPPSSRLSTLLHTSLHIVLPFLFFTNFIIAGTIVLSYTLYLGQPVPARFAVGASVAFGGLVVVGIVLFVWVRCRCRSARNIDDDGSRDTEAKADVERRLTGGVARRNPPQKEPHTPASEMRTNPATAEQHLLPTHQHPLHLQDWPRHPAAPSQHNAPEPPVEAYRGHAHTLQPPRRGSVELSAIRERSLEHTYHGQFNHPPAARPPGDAQETATGAAPAPAGRRVYRSPSIASSVPESLRPGPGLGLGRGLGTGTGTPRPDVQGRTTQWGAGVTGSSSPVSLPMPRVPPPLKLGPSITGRGGGAWFEEGGGGVWDRRQGQKGTGG